MDKRGRKKQKKMKITNDLNIKRQAQEYGLRIWQTPGFLLVMIAASCITMMVTTFLAASDYFNQEYIVAAEAVIASLTFIICYTVIRVADEIIKLNRMKNEFVSVASHQLRTPLSAIRWETELLLSKFKKGLDQKQTKNIETISVLANRMTRLVNDLLDVTRIDQNRLVLKKEPVDIVKTIKEEIEELLPLAGARNIEIIFAPKKNIPRVIGDSERLKMVVENLLSNSVKYTTNRGKIEIKISKKDAFVIVSIKDNGVGIPESQTGRVFEKFFRSDNAVKYQTDGTGLGLYISKNIVEQSGGRIWFQSVENLGSIFSFSLRVKK
jgi:signal transduction histidine kinase